MLCFSIGLPGQFADWCDAVIGRLAGYAADRRVLWQWPATDAMLAYEPSSAMLDEIARFLITSDASGLVIGARQPDIALRRALADTGARFVVGIEDPRVAAADLLDMTGADARLVTRAVANSCALLMHYPHLAGALAVDSAGARSHPVGVVTAIAAHLGVALDEKAARLIVEDIAAHGAGLAPLCDWAQRLPEAARKTLDGALSAYEQCVAGQGFGRIIWRRDLFFTSDDGRRADEVVDLAGGARIVVFGPHIYLPAGSWTAQVFLGVSPEAAGHTLLIEAYAGAQLAVASFQPGTAGIFATELSFVLGEPEGHAVEIRVFVTQDDAKGRLAFGQVVLQPAGMVRRPDAIGDWDAIASVLDL